jgi:hypothetical protein
MGTPGPGRNIQPVDRGSLTMAARAAALTCALALALAGCGSSGDQAYQDLEHALMTGIPKHDHRAVKSVSCTPHADEVVENSTVDFQCVVRFPDGSSSTIPASIRNPSQQFGWSYYLYSWDSPGAPDITRQPLPTDTATLAADSPHSLFYAKNLGPALSALAAHFAGGQLILELALYPDELEAVVGANGSAQRVTVDTAARLTVNDAGSFDGTRTGIGITQLDPTVPQQLAGLIAAHGHVSTASLSRFVLDLTSPEARWDIFASAPGTRFRSLLSGGSLTELTATGSRPLS